MLRDLRPVYVVGIGLHRYQALSDTPYVALGLEAIRMALADAGIAWPVVQSAYVATAKLPMSPGRPMLRHLGTTGIPIVHIENASASGSAAVRQACIEVGAGIADVALAVGVDKPMPRDRAERVSGTVGLVDRDVVPFTHFALLAEQYAQRAGIAVTEVARVAVKNHANGARNVFAQRQQVRSLEEVLGGRRISGALTSLQCTPVGEGAAAVIIASEEGMRRAGIDPARAIRVTASAARSQTVDDGVTAFDEALTRDTVAEALAQAGVPPSALDVIELHDAFSVEELEYAEAIGLSAPGQALAMLREGAFDIGGSCAVSPSGGLIAMGHPIGPTGIGQVAEVTRQLRGEAGDRQQPNARIGLAHMVGVGAVCYAHLLERP